MTEAVTNKGVLGIFVEDRDLKQLQELDPSQTDGYRSCYRAMVPCSIRLVDDEEGDVIDRQEVVINVLEKKKQGELTGMRVELSSEIDLYFNFASNCSPTQFEDLRSRNCLNIKFRDFPAALAKIFEGCKEGSKEYSYRLCSRNNLELTISRDNINHLRVTQQTEYKDIDLVQLTFLQADSEKVNQSIVYRYNYQKAKLAMLDSALQSIYGVLEKKNASLLQHIKKTVGYI